MPPTTWSWSVLVRKVGLAVRRDGTAFTAHEVAGSLRTPFQPTQDNGGVLTQ